MNPKENRAVQVDGLEENMLIQKATVDWEKVRKVARAGKEAHFDRKEKGGSNREGHGEEGSGL